MTTYYRVSDGALRELTPENFAVMQSNGKAADLRLFVVDAQPVPAAGQAVAAAGIVVGPVEAHQTWSLRSKIADELETDALLAEKALVQGYIDDLNVQLAIDNAARALLTNVQRINELEKDTRSTMKAVKFLLRQSRRALL